MWTRRVAIFIVSIYTLLIANSGLAQDEHGNTNTLLVEGEKKMSENILLILDHFKKPDPIGMPGASIPDPYPVPDMKQSLPIGTMNFRNTAVYGISRFRILYVNVEIETMEVQAIMSIGKLQARGNYSLITWLNRAQGPFTVDVTGVRLTARANIGVERDGKLRAQDINVDITPNSINMNFENLGLLGNFIQGFVNSVSTFVFDSIKPHMLKEAYATARTEINKELDKVAGDMQFPNSVSPLDMVIADARKKVRDMNIDPYKVKDYNTTVGMFTVTLSNTWVMGISSFHRVGNISLKMENNTAIADFEIGTQKLEGLTQWEISAINGLLSRAGTASFSVEYISGRFVLGQPLDTRKRPEFRDLDLEVGNIQVRFDGAGTIDYAVEFGINILPNLLRYQIMDALEGPIKEKVQQEFNKINVEEFIMQKLPELDQIQDNDFKLSALLNNTEEKQGPYDDDEFFDF